MAWAATRRVLPVLDMNRDGPIRQDECALVTSRVRSSGYQSRRRDHERTSIAGCRLSKVAGLQQHESLLRLERAVGQSIIERSELNILADSQRDRRTGKTTVSRVRGRAG